MKTPRDILFARHQNVVPKLDAIRNNVLSAEFRKAGQASSLSPSKNIKKSETGSMPVPLLIWHELIWPSRRIWAGLAAVWILIFCMDFSMRDTAPVVAEKAAPPSPEVIVELKQQQRMLAELIGAGQAREAEPVKLFLPQPRSERVEVLMT